MTKIYLLSLIPEGFKELDLPEGKNYIDFDCMRWNGKSKLMNWKSPELVWVNDEFSLPDDTQGDFTKFMGGAIALSQKAYSLLKPILADKVEFLSVYVDQQEWFLMNVVNVLSVMDVARSKFKIYEDGQVGACQHAYIVEPAEYDSAIFLVEGYFPNIFINQHTKDFIESSELTGALIREYLNP